MDRADLVHRGDRIFESPGAVVSCPESIEVVPILWLLGIRLYSETYQSVEVGHGIPDHHTSVNHRVGPVGVFGHSEARAHFRAGAAAAVMVTCRAQGIDSLSG